MDRPTGQLIGEGEAEDASLGERKPLLPPYALFVFLGILFLAIYFIIAQRFNYFFIAELDYLGNPYLNFFFSSIQLSSLVLKLIILLPAAFFLAVGLTLKSSLGSISRVLHQRYLLIALCALALILYILTINLVLQKTEVTDDEPTFDLQAKIFLKGKLYVTPPVKNSFNNIFVLRDDKFTGQYQFGHPLALAIGLALGSPYVCIVLFGILYIVLINKISLLLFKDKRLAALASLLVCLSPFFFLTGSTRLTHSTSAFFLYLFLYLFLKITQRTDRKIDFLLAFVAGISAGYAFNVRPLTALAFLVPLSIFGLLQLLKYKKPVFLKYCLMSLGFLFFIILTLAYNKAITGHYLTFPYLAYNPMEKPGFHVLAGGGRHSLENGFFNLGINIIKVNIALFGFAYSLAFLAFFMTIRPKLTGDKLFLSIIGVFSFFYLFYHGMGVSDTGPVYCYELIGILVILSSRAIFKMNNLIRDRWPKAGSFLSGFLLLSFIFAGVTYDLEKSVQLRMLTSAIREPYVKMEAAGLHQAVVFIQSMPNKGFVYGYRNNSPDFDDDVILCRFLNPEDNTRVMDHFPNRKYYVLRYNKSIEESELVQMNRQQLLESGQRKK